MIETCKERAMGLMTSVLRLVALGLALALAGCVTAENPAVHVTSAPAAGPIPPGQAAIAIARVEAYIGSAAPADVDVNGTKFASIEQGTTFTGFVRPGPVALSVSCWCGPGRYTVHFKAEAGRRYAFEISPRSEQVGAMLVGGVIGLAADTVAHAETSGTFKLSEVSSGQ